MTTTLSRRAARRIALRAQGIGRARSAERLSPRASRQALRLAVDRNSLLQLDSVSVFARAHLMPVFSRSGNWDTSVLNAAMSGGPGGFLVENLAHVATVTTREVDELLHFRREGIARSRDEVLARLGDDGPEALERLVEAVREHGPISAAGLSRVLGDSERDMEAWGWRRTGTQWALEHLFHTGRLVSAGRSSSFGRLLAVPEAQAPPRATTTEQDVLELVRLAARAHGIATEADLADHFRMRLGTVRPAVAALRASGELEDITVRCGEMDVPMLRHRDAPGSSPQRAACLLSPFDPVLFHRPRLEALYDVHCRIGIYTPKAQRTHGYYALPFLLGDQVVARTDLRASRREGVLEILGAWTEPLQELRRHEATPAHEEIAAVLAEELRLAARWQDLDALRVEPQGDLAGPLGDVLGHGTVPVEDRDAAPDYDGASDAP